MFSMPYLCICLYCMLQLGFFIVMENKHRSAKMKQKRYFLWMLVIVFLSFMADILSSFCAGAVVGPAWLFPFVACGNYVEVFLNTILALVFYKFICEQINTADSRLMHRISLVLWGMALINVTLLVSNIFTGQIFYFDASHVYHRGPLFLPAMFGFLAMMVIIEAFLIFQHKKIESRTYRSLTAFLIAPLVGWVFQSLIFGLPFSLISIVFAAQIVFANMQNRNIDEDYLTGAFTRKALDFYMQQRIDIAISHGGFSAILLDIDNFKSINDRFGHGEGDIALITSVRLLRDSVGRKDFVARYGGDEFCIILDSRDPNAAEETVRRILSRLADFNQRSGKPYRMEFSMGYAAYQPSFGDKAELFLKVIDRKMYEEKNAHRSAAPAENQ